MHFNPDYGALHTHFQATNGFSKVVSNARYLVLHQKYKLAL